MQRRFASPDRAEVFAFGSPTGGRCERGRRAGRRQSTTSFTQRYPRARNQLLRLAAHRDQQMQLHRAPSAPTRPIPSTGECNRSGYLAADSEPTLDLARGVPRSPSAPRSRTHLCNLTAVPTRVTHIDREPHLTTLSEMVPRFAITRRRRRLTRSELCRRRNRLRWYSRARMREGRGGERRAGNGRLCTDGHGRLTRDVAGVCVMAADARRRSLREIRLSSLFRRPARKS